MAIPSRVGFTVSRQTFGTGAQTKYLDIPVGTVAGDHMIVFIEWAGGLPSSATTGYPHWPVGWQEIEYENHGTRGYALWYAGTYTSGGQLTVTFTPPNGGGATFSLAVIRGAVDFSSWVIGTWWDRNGLGGGVMNTTTRALPISAPDNSLVLSFHGEATNAVEDGATSISNSTKWYESDPQTVASSSIERVYVGYREVAAAETTPTVDVIWPNSAQNGAAMQVAIPGLSLGPSVGGTVTGRNATSASPMVLDISTIPTGGWMLVSVMSSVTNMTVTPPSGWTTLHTRETTGTRSNYLFGKIKESSDGSSASFSQNNNVTAGFGLMWGTGSAPIEAWDIGSSAVRSTNGQPSGARYINNAPSITTGFDNSLVVAVSNEATLALSASYEVSSFTAGWTERLWFAQPAVNTNIETIWMGTKVLGIKGATGNVAVTYISQQDNNGWGMQVAIPPPLPPVEVAPYVVESTETFATSTGSTLTLNRPAATQNGDMLVAILRSQDSLATADWALSGWTRYGPAFPGSSSARLNTMLVRLVTNIDGEPSSYVFNRSKSDSSRRVGHLILVRADGGVPEVQGWDPVYGGENPAGSVDMAPLTYSITPPVLEILWGASEFASPQDHAITAAPVGYTDIRYTTTNTNTGSSRTVLYTGSRVYLSGSTTIQAGVDWLGTTSGPAAGSITFAIGEMPDQTGSGLLLADGNGNAVNVYHTVSGGVRTPQQVKPMLRGFASVADMLATPGFTWAHRGGSASYPEHSLFAYTQAIYRGYGVLEISLGRTSDGVWFGLHDQTTDRTSGGTYGNASSQTWAQIQAQTNVEHPENPQPYMRWDELIAIYGSTHVIVADPKYALGSYRTEFLNMVNNDLGPTRAIIKYSGVGSGATALSTAAQALGFQTWGFFYAGDASAAQGGSGTLQTWGPYWTLIGMEYGASQAIWDEVLALGKPAIGHIAPTQAAYDTAIAKGASGVQVSGVAVVEPVSWWEKVSSQVPIGIVSVAYSENSSGDNISVTLPSGSGGSYVVFVVGTGTTEQPETPIGWSLINWSVGNPALQMGIYSAPGSASAPSFNLNNGASIGIVAIAIRVNKPILDIGGDGATDSYVSPTVSSTEAAVVVRTISSDTEGLAAVTFGYPANAPNNRTQISSAGFSGGTAIALASSLLPSAGASGAATWTADSGTTTRAGTFILQEAPIIAPIAAWSFSEGSGTTTEDYIGTRHLTVATGNWGTGYVGNGLASGSIVTIPSKAGLETSTRTLMFWANWNGNGGNWRWGVDFHLTGLDTSCWGIMPINGSGELYCRIRIGGVNTNITLSNGANDATWHHYAITYNGSSFIAYRDGAIVGSVSVSGTIDTCDEIVIHPAGGTNTIDSLKVFNQALNQSQILYQMST